jgi:hypothetical protein
VPARPYRPSIRELYLEIAHHRYSTLSCAPYKTKPKPLIISKGGRCAIRADNPQRQAPWERAPSDKALGGGHGTRTGGGPRLISVRPCDLYPSSRLSRFLDGKPASPVVLGMCPTRKTRPRCNRPRYGAPYSSECFAARSHWRDGRLSPRDAAQVRSRLSLYVQHVDRCLAATARLSMVKATRRASGMFRSSCPAKLRLGRSNFFQNCSRSRGPLSSSNHSVNFRTVLPRAAPIANPETTSLA